MGFKVIYKGLEVICDTFEDLDALAEQANSRKAKQNAPTVRPEQKASTTTSSVQQDGDPLWNFIQALSDKTVNLLSVLVAKGALTDTQLRSELGLDNNMQIAGRVAPISRYAKKFGLKPESVLKTKVISNKPGGRKYEYDVQETAKSYIRRRTQGDGG